MATDKNVTDAGVDEAGALWLTRIGEFFLDGLFLMLAFGVAHGTDHALPTFGYWQSCFFAWVLSGIAATGTLGVTARVKKFAALSLKRGRTY